MSTTLKQSTFVIIKITNESLGIAVKYAHQRPRPRAKDMVPFRTEDRNIDGRGPDRSLKERS